MKSLELEQMEQIKGSGNGNAVLCGIGIGLLFTPAAFWGVLIATTCLMGDSNQ